VAHADDWSLAVRALLALDAIAAPLWATAPRVIEGPGQLVLQFNFLAIGG